MTSESSPFKVWMFTDVYPPRISGVSFIARSLERLLPQNGIDVRIIRTSNTLWKSCRDAHKIEFRALKDIGFRGDDFALFSALHQSVVLRDNQPNAILVLTPGRVGLLGLSLSSLFKIPCVFMYTTDLLEYSRHYGSFRATGSVLTKLAFLLGVSRSARAALIGSPIRTADLSGKLRMASRFLAAMQAPADSVILLSRKRLAQVQAWSPSTPCHVVPVGVDRLPSPKKDRVTKEGDPIRLLYVGRLAREKNLLILPHVLKALERRGVDAHLELVGDGELRGRLEIDVARLGLAESVSFSGPIARELLGGYYRNADVFLFPSISETQGLVLNEAALEALPLVVCDPTANAVAVPNRSALLAEPSVASISDAVEGLYRSPGLARRLGLEARQLASALTEDRYVHSVARIVRATARQSQNDARG